VGQKNNLNRDISKILETIGLNDSEAVKDLRHRIGLLTEENGLFSQHLEGLKETRDQLERGLQERNLELEQNVQEITHLKRALEDALTRE
jgi:hypothetical protein